MSRFPYAGLPRQQIWKRAVSDVEPARIDPQHAPSFHIDRTTKISSAGSCFAQRIAERLASAGYTYVVYEQGPLWRGSRWCLDHHYGVYSARFGDIYTTLQLLQLAQACVGEFQSAEEPWSHNGFVVDPQRPRVHPSGFSSVDELRADRVKHLAAVRRMFEDSDVFVFTLGLTEAWCTRADGTALPLCPGSGIGVFDDEKYVFRNLSVAENIANLNAFCDIVFRLNPHLRIIFTVSPVPLAATMEARHVIESTVWSKSVLRVAAEELFRTRRNVEYFASYEMISSGFSGVAGFERDGRTVSESAVDRVMESFFANFVDGSCDARSPKLERASMVQAGTPLPKPDGDVCDEVHFERFLNAQEQAAQS